jgi:putative peptidoglycan lipid II flippase
MTPPKQALSPSITKPGARAPHRRTGTYSFLVASGMFLSKVAGLIRDRVIAYYFGNSEAADAFRAAFRIPNFLQNLFGEGVLSASFIPVYANMLARGDEKEARRLSGAIFALLSLVVSTLVLVGVLASPYLIDAIAPGFEGEKRALTIRLVRILFPGSGILVLSAWCLGILNSHRKFFLSYVAPVGWNLVIILTLLLFGPRQGQYDLAATLAWGSVVGSGLQFAVQLPMVLRLSRGIAPNLAVHTNAVRTVVRNFLPVFVGRGVIQISAYVDNILASLLPTGAVAALNYAQTIYLIPVSLFGMSVSAAELPAMSSATGSEQEIAAWLRGRLDPGLRRIAFFIVPSAVAFLALGDVFAGAFYQTGRFTHDDTLYVWAVMAGSTVGLLAATLGRLYSATFYALRDTRIPLLCAVARVSLGTVLGYTLSIYGPSWFGIEQRWGIVGITVASGSAAWVEFVLLRALLNRRIGRTGLPFRLLAALWVSATLGAVGAWGVRLLVGGWHPIPMAVVVLGAYGLIYLGTARLLRIPEVSMVTARLLRFVGR